MTSNAKPKGKAGSGSERASDGDDRALIRELAELLAETGLTEIELERSGLRLRVARSEVVTANVAAPAVASAPVAQATAAPALASPAAPDAAVDLSKHPGAVKSPMVGTIYRAAEPGAANFVEVGTQVREGQTLVIIEAMKTMNHIPAPRSGTVAQILCDNEQPVEFGEPLMIIE
ncbi:MAG: acetyl-CoA carboxylase biotin carboxyl carrier protein [Pseudomonadota bacterium]